jgi:hypothetical protein
MIIWLGRFGFSTLSPYLSMALIALRRRHRHNPRRTIPLIAFGTAKPLHNVGKVCIPTGERGEGMWVAAATVAALAFKKNRVLPEFIA